MRRGVWAWAVCAGLGCGGSEAPPTPTAASAPAAQRAPAELCASWIQSTPDQRRAATLANLEKLRAALESAQWDPACLLSRVDGIVSDLSLMCGDDGRGADDELFLSTLRTSASDHCPQR